MPKIEVTKCGGNAEVAIRRLKRLCDRLGIQKRIRALEHHVKKTTKQRRMKDAARKRSLKRQATLEATRRSTRRRAR
ncbi:MAG: 30S ribosomal protein S21 [Legionellales bacterium]|nr:30S ribosomal protein S21 [Legionellales bacterium]